MKQFRKHIAHMGRNIRATPVYIELRGRESVLCDGFCRITGYSDKRIELCSDTDGIEITGDGLTLRHLSLGKLAIDGRIDRIGFLQTDTLSVR